MEEPKKSDVPSQKASLGEICNFCRIFFGYKNSSVKETADIYLKLKKKLEKGAKISDFSIDDLAYSIFFLIRASHHAGTDPTKEEMRFIRNALKQIRAKAKE